MGDSATAARVKAMDVSVNTASHSGTGMGMSMVLARGGTVVAEHGGNLKKLELAFTDYLNGKSLCFCSPP